MAVKDKSIASPITLKCGLTLPNRLVKAAMAEHEVGADMLPNDALLSSYEPWAGGGWGMVMTGNVQIDARYLGHAGDVAYNDSVSYEKQLAAWKRWAEVCNRSGTPTIVQINHPGRQSMPFAGTKSFWEKNISSSAVPMSLGVGLLPFLVGKLVFGTPKEMTLEDIQHVVQGFAKTAKLAADAGFAGAEIHGAHGYLIDQFLSENINQRTDEYGGSPAKRVRIVLEIIEAMRAVVPASFCIGIKFNSVDHQSTERLRECVEGLKLITAAGVDFMEVSGGSYENPRMMGISATAEKQSDRTKAREAFFLEFASTIRREFPDTPLMVTGGFRTRKGMQAALDGGDCELIGLGRPAALDPTLPLTKILNVHLKDEDAKLYTRKLQSLPVINAFGLKSMIGVMGAGSETADMVLEKDSGTGKVVIDTLSLMDRC